MTRRRNEKMDVRLIDLIRRCTHRPNPARLIYLERSRIKIEKDEMIPSVGGTIQYNTTQHNTIQHNAKPHTFLCVFKIERDGCCDEVQGFLFAQWHS